MARRWTVAALLILCVCVPTGKIAGGQAATPAPSKGTQIGQIVSDAVNTAFPVIGKIMDLFSSKKTASKDDVQTAVTTAQNAFVTQAKQKVQPVAAISKELAVVQAFATAGVSASQNLATITRLLGGSTTDFGSVNTEWTVAKNYLADVLAMKSTDIQTVRSSTIQARIITLQNARKDLMVRIDANIAAAQKNAGSVSKTDLESQIAAMSALLNGFDTLAAVELGMLESDIDDLAKWANSPAGPITFAPKPPSPKLLKIIDNAARQAGAASH